MLNQDLFLKLKPIENVDQFDCLINTMRELPNPMSGTSENGLRV